MGVLAAIGWWCYQLVMATTLAVAAPFLLARRGRHYLTTLRGRLGLYGESTLPRGAVWVHAVSVGEVAVAATLIAELRDDLPLVVTTVTPTGQERARNLFAKRPRTAVAYLPFDFGFAVASFFRRFEPAALILIEGDYWPLVLAKARRRNVPVAVVNGRVGERSSRRLRRFRGLGKRLFFAPVSCFAMQTEEDRRRLVAAGAEAERIHVAGNLKFDAEAPAAQPQLEALMRSLAGDRPILLAGSTMGGEEEQLLQAFGRVGGGERALLFIAPRHPERFDGVARRVEEQGFACLRRSQIDDATQRADVVVLDTLGELAAAYKVADIAFIGGTLVPTGGHNPLEPALFAVPTVVGPSMHNFREMAESFDAQGAWSRAADSHRLAEVWDAWLSDPSSAAAVGERAAALLAANRGALRRTLDLIEPLLPVPKEPL